MSHLRTLSTLFIMMSALAPHFSLGAARGHDRLSKRVARTQSISFPVLVGSKDNNGVFKDTGGIHVIRFPTEDFPLSSAAVIDKVYNSLQTYIENDLIPNPGPIDNLCLVYNHDIIREVTREMVQHNASTLQIMPREDAEHR